MYRRSERQSWQLSVRPLFEERFLGREHGSHRVVSVFLISEPPQINSWDNVYVNKVRGTILAADTVKMGGVHPQKHVTYMASRLPPVKKDVKLKRRVHTVWTCHHSDVRIF